MLGRARGRCSRAVLRPGRARWPAGSPPAALAAPDACSTRVNDTHAKLAECITLAGVREHQAALQRIADANHGTRVSGSPGYDASVDYVVQRLRAVGYTPDVQAFVFNTFVSLAPSVVERVSPAPTGQVTNTILAYSGSGDVTAAVTALPGTPVDATPGCDVADFAGLPGRQDRPGHAWQLHLRRQGSERACGRRGSAVIISTTRAPTSTAPSARASRSTSPSRR